MNNTILKTAALLFAVSTSAYAASPAEPDGSSATTKSPSSTQELRYEPWANLNEVQTSIIDEWKADSAFNSAVKYMEKSWLNYQEAALNTTIVAGSIKIPYGYVVKYEEIITELSAISDEETRNNELFKAGKEAVNDRNSLRIKLKNQLSSEFTPTKEAANNGYYMLSLMLDALQTLGTPS